MNDGGAFLGLLWIKVELPPLSVSFFPKDLLSNFQFYSWEGAML